MPQAIELQVLIKLINNHFGISKMNLVQQSLIVTVEIFFLLKFKKVPNVKLTPFLYSPNNTLNEESIAYTVIVK